MAAKNTYLATTASLSLQVINDGSFVPTAEITTLGNTKDYEIDYKSNGIRENDKPQELCTFLMTKEQVVSVLDFYGNVFKQLQQLDTVIVKEQPTKNEPKSEKGFDLLD